MSGTGKFFLALFTAIAGGVISAITGICIARSCARTDDEPRGGKDTAVIVIREPIPQRERESEERESTKDIEKQRVKNVVLDWVDAWERKDFDRQMRYCTSDFFYTDDQGIYYSRDEYERHKKMLWQRYQTIRVEVVNLKVHVDGDKARVEYIQTYQGTICPGAGSSYSSEGKEVLYLRKYGERWLIYEEYFQKF